MLSHGRPIAIVLWIVAAAYLLSAGLDFLLIADQSSPSAGFEYRPPGTLPPGPTWAGIGAQLGTAALYLGLGAVVDLLGQLVVTQSASEE